MSDGSAIFRFDDPVTLIGGGVVSEDALVAAQARSAALVAADGGANRWSARKNALDAVIGDLDSLDDVAAWRAALADRLLHLQEQDTTDLEKCLYSVAAPLYFGVGFQGARVDHSLAALHVLRKRADRRLLFLEETDVIFLAPRLWRIHLPIGARVSLIPLTPTRALRSSGLRWALDGLTLSLGRQIGASNQTTESRVEVFFAGPDGSEDPWSGVAVVLDRAHLDAALDSLAPDDADPRSA